MKIEAIQLVNLVSIVLLIIIPVVKLIERYLNMHLDIPTGGHSSVGVDTKNQNFPEVHKVKDIPQEKMTKMIWRNPAV